MDQSFWSDVYDAQEGKQNLANDQVKRLFSKLQTLKECNKVFLIISDIHAGETSAIPKPEKRKGVWKLQNDAADGKIASNWSDIFVVQHQRVLSGNGRNSYPMADIGLDEAHHRTQFGVKIVMTNSWRLKVHDDYSPRHDEFNNDAYKIITRQAENIPQCRDERDCLNYIHGLWRNNIRQGIAAWKQSLDIQQKFEQLGKLPSAEQMASPDVPFRRVVSDVTRGFDGMTMLKRWSDILEANPIGPCPSLRINTAVEAEMLWTWYQGNRHNKFNQNFGLSRQNDISHIAAFAPYVDVLTTDNDMRNVCGRRIVSDELKQFRCKLFSKKNYDKLESLLDDLIRM